MPAQVGLEGPHNLTHVLYYAEEKETLILTV